MTNKPIRILLVEDQKLMRVGLKSLFEGQNELEVVSEAQTGKEETSSHFGRITTAKFGNCQYF